MKKIFVALSMLAFLAACDDSSSASVDRMMNRLLNRLLRAVARSLSLTK